MAKAEKAERQTNVPVRGHQASLQRRLQKGDAGCVEESLSGNRVFTVRLVGSGNMLLVHPLQESGMRFLPCVYGYTTTVRRAQAIQPWAY